MPILNDDTFFIHIPKTGGTSIEKAFNINCYDYYTVDYKTLFGQYDDNNTLQHLTYNELCDYIDISKYTYTTVVRNPFDRVVSEFHHQFTQCGTDKVIEKFEWFLDGFLKIDSDFLRHKIPQIDFINDIYDNIKILRFENLSNDFLNYFGFKLNFHERKSNRFNYKDYYKNNDYTNMVYEFYKMDFEKFGYEF